MRETVYKGATRPPLLFGVPLTYGVVVALGGACLTFNLFVLSRSLVLLGVCAAAVAAILIWMFVQTRRDDQKVDQMILRWSMRTGRATRRRWHCISYACGPSRLSRDREHFR